MNLRKLTSVLLLMALLGAMLSGCEAAPPKPIIPEDFLRETDIPDLEEACYALLEEAITPFVDLQNLMAGDELLSEEDVTVTGATLLPYVYSFYEKPDDGARVDCLAIAFTYEMHGENDALELDADISSYNFLILRAPSRDESGTLQARFSLEREVPTTRDWAEEEAIFLFGHCTDGQSILISEYSGGEVTRSSLDRDACLKYRTDRHR